MARVDQFVRERQYGRREKSFPAFDTHPNVFIIVPADSFCFRIVASFRGGGPASVRILAPDFSSRSDLQREFFAFHYVLAVVSGV